MQSGRLIRKYLPTTVELLLFYLFLLGLLSVPTTSAVLAAILNGGKKTQFPPSDPRVGFRAGPESRGTMNIVWVCMSTIFTCVYVSVHVDVPDPSKAKDIIEQISHSHGSHPYAPSVFLRAYAAVLYWTAKPWCKRIVWLLFNVFAPELVVLVAALELFSARDGMRFMQACGQTDWSLKLAFFADMGGFEWRPAAGERQQFRSGLEFLEWFGSTRGVLDVAHLELEIADKCKTNTVLKVFTVLQASWLLVQTIVRMAEHKAVSELEVTTCAYIACTVVAYGCWVRKPYDIGRRIVLREENFIPSAESVLTRGPPSPSTSTPLPSRDSAMTATNVAGGTALSAPKTQDSYFASCPMPPTMIYKGAKSSPFNRSYFKPDVSWPLACHLAGLMGTVVGFIHAAPLWNALFINTTGQWLWRFCCILQVATPVSIAAISVIEKWYIDRAMYIAMYAGAFVYCVSRVVLFALIVLSFFSLPASVYVDVDWSWAYFPHWH